MAQRTNQIRTRPNCKLSVALKGCESFMPIKLPNLDDRTFADLVEEAHALIPVHAPEWTNHNESDPGITFVELFAYLTEMLIYRLNRVTDANMCAFLRLIDGIERRPSTKHRGMVWRVVEEKEVALSDEVRDAVLNLRQQDRAVTCEDFERLAKAADTRVKRAHCVPQRDLTSKSPDKKADAHVSVVIFPGDGDLLEKVRQYLEPRRLLATRLHVVAPREVIISVHLSFFLKPDANREVVKRKVEDKLKHFFTPVGDKRDDEGWPFGRNVYVSEIYRLVDRIPGVDFVTRIKDEKGELGDILKTQDEGRRILQKGELVAIRLDPDELVNLSLDQSEIVLVTPTEKDLER